MLSLSLTILPVAICAWFVLRIIYRLYFHPLAKIPGPKWAAITSLYSACYDIPIETSYTRKIIQLHEQYGPVIRIMPNWVHILDMKSYDEVFRANSKFYRPDVPVYNNPPLDGSLWNTCDPMHARIRRAVYLPFFSRQSIKQLEGLIQKQVLKFLTILEDKATNASEKPVNFTRGYKCLAADTIMQYCCMRVLGFLDAKDFNAPLIVALDAYFSNVPMQWHFPRFDRFMGRTIGSLPDSMIKKIAPALIETMYIQRANKERVKELLAAHQAGEDKQSETRCLLENAIAARPQTGETRLGEDELAGDLFLLFAAGTDTTGNTLTFGTWYLLNNPEAYQKLKKELRDFIPDLKSDQLKSWQELETLPYLTAVIKESLRLSFGAVHRMMRVSHDTEHVVQGHRLPPGTIICYSNGVHNLSEKYFKDAKKFVPERWLEANSHDLEHNLVSFPRGPRTCIGQNLAWAELYITFAYLFRRFDVENAGTTAEGMEWLDYFVPYTKEHLMVRLRPAVE